MRRGSGDDTQTLYTTHLIFKHEIMNIITVKHINTRISSHYAATNVVSFLILISENTITGKVKTNIHYNYFIIQ
jgi:hypothetical protein